MTRQILNFKSTCARGNARVYPSRKSITKRTQVATCILILCLKQIKL